jgi:hypothetical protein
VVQEETLSGNTIGARIYTDAKREAKMLPDHPWLAKCPFCGGLFWVDEAVKVSFGFEAAKGKKKVLAPPEKEMLNFLAGSTLPQDKEIYLRIRAFWSANDACRSVPNATPAFSKKQVKNLKALSSILDEAEPGELILKAEIARELGNFDECLRLLAHPFENNYEGAVGFIRKLAEDKVQAVKPFEPGK